MQQSEQPSISPKTARNRRWLDKNPGYYEQWRAKHPEYASWKAMIQRCTNPNMPGYERYGGRGITIHEEWRKSYKAFIRDMGPRPGPGWSLDRIDNDGNYEPGNVRWASRTQQQKNKTSGVSAEALAMIKRLRKDGMSWRNIADALNSAGIETPRRKTWHGFSVQKAAVRAGIVSDGKDSP